MPTNPGDATAESLLSIYLESKDQIPLTIQGDAESSPYGSLDQGLSGITLQTSCVFSVSRFSETIADSIRSHISFPGQGIPLVDNIRIYLDLVQAFCSNNASFDFQVSFRFVFLSRQITSSLSNSFLTRLITTWRRISLFSILRVLQVKTESSMLRSITNLRHHSLRTRVKLLEVTLSKYLRNSLKVLLVVCLSSPISPQVSIS